MLLRMKTQARSREVTSASMSHTGCPREGWLGLCLYRPSSTYQIHISVVAQASQLSFNISTISPVYKISGDTKELWMSERHLQDQVQLREEQTMN